MAPINLVGKKFSRLIVIAYDETSKKSGHAYWICKCICGTIKSIRSSHLKTGNVKSCGCLAKEVSSQLLKKYASSDAHKGKGNPQWKGDTAQHGAIHTWLNKHYQKVMCEKCGALAPLDFALRKGRKHSHNIENYMVLCRSHHLEYDYTNSRRLKISNSLKKYAKKRG